MRTGPVLWTTCLVLGALVCAESVGFWNHPAYRLILMVTVLRGAGSLCGLQNQADLLDVHRTFIARMSLTSARTNRVPPRATSEPLNALVPTVCPQANGPIRVTPESARKHWSG